MPEMEEGKHYWKDEGGDAPFPFSAGGTHLGCCAQFWAPQCQTWRAHCHWGVSRTGASLTWEDAGTLCSLAWRREGSGGISSTSINTLCPRPEKADPVLFLFLILQDEAKDTNGNTGNSI